MNILYLILNIAAIVILVFLVIGLKGKIKKSKTNPALKSKIIKAVGFGLIVVTVPLFLVYNFIEEPELQTREQQVGFYKKHNYFLHLNNVYYEMLQDNPYDLKLHFDFVNTIQQHYYSPFSNNTEDLETMLYSHESKRIESYYSGFIDGKDSVKRDIGLLFLSFHYINLDENKKASPLLSRFNNESILYSNYIRGKYYVNFGDTAYFSLADSLLTLALVDSIERKEAYNELAQLYYYFGEEDELMTLVNDPEAQNYLRVFYKRISYMRSLNFFKYWQAIFHSELKAFNLWGFVSSLLILFVWLFYLRRIDVFENESWFYLLLTLFLGMGFTYWVYPLHDILSDTFNYFPSQHPLSDFIYDVISIGAVEELVKIIPVLLILWFTRAINEPFDYILYPSISALGFAFIENVGYIQEYSLYNINARAFVSTIAHVVFSSTIGYGMMLARYRKGYNPFINFLIFFGLAALMHGFFDFWLMNGWAQKFKWITFLYFIISIQIWHVYANNTLNITTFYDPKITIKNDWLKYYLIVSLIGIFMFSYVANAASMGGEYASVFLKRSLFVYGYFILFLTFTLSRFQIVRGYLAPFKIPLNFLVPKINRFTNFTAMPVKLYATKIHSFIPGFEKIRQDLPVTGTLEKRIIIDDKEEAYVVVLDRPISIESYLNDRVLIMPKKVGVMLNESGNILIHLMLIPSAQSIDKPMSSLNDFEFIGWAVSKRIEEKDKT
jgi:RsiW-degrading membrane proteinase PrsW (M82 family)